MRRKVMLIILLMFMVIGYASLSTTLNIYGNSKLVENISDFKVYLDNVKLNGEKIEVLNENKDEIKIDNKFSGTLEYEIINDSTEYDAEVSLDCVGNTFAETKWNFDYTGSEQTFTAPINGTYQLETWGAQGGSMHGTGGYGGYSKAKIKLSNNDILYVNVGNQPSNYNVGGYNGGGTGLYAPNVLVYLSSGGGATHIAINSGLLSQVEDKNLLVVSGGGGGGANYGIDLVGTSGSGLVNDSVSCYFYSKKTPVTSNLNAFGSRGIGVNGYGGGGGHTGGGSHMSDNIACAASGGTGYIGNTLLTEKSMYCYNCTESNEESTKTISTTCANEIPTAHCAKLGNGYARITFDDANIPITTEDELLEAKSLKTNSIKNLNYHNLTCKLKISKISRTEKAKEPSKPVLTDGLIPVTIANDGTVTYADTNTSWYNYGKRIWANAVILEDNKNYKIGDTISESDIESYFVWIPRFRYRIFNKGNYSSLLTLESNSQTIEIEFEDKNEETANGQNVGEWLTHPAFTSFNTNGFWVGKFETGYKGAKNKSEARVNEQNVEKITIKPMTYTWANINIKNMFETSYNYQRSLDSHMMKNTEWGAVAYLSNSKYGINRKINLNNNNDYKTGYSALLTTNQDVYPGESGDGDNYNKLYNTEVGYLASTTGNISGIYDMSGGVSEIVSAYMENDFSLSGFTAENISNYADKYFDIYDSSSSTYSYNKRILGDATGEMGPFARTTRNETDTIIVNSWYGECSAFVEANNSWFYRSGTYGDGKWAGLFYFNRSDGQAKNYLTFRLVLTP